MNNKTKTSNIIPVNILNFLVQEERRSGVILIIVAIAALFAANSSLSSIYFDFIYTELTFGIVSLDIQHWVSEGLMAIFFLVVVLEVKREFIDGELRTWRKASFPVIAAIGGMLLPALIYSSINTQSPQSIGWAIPIATDIAIGIGVLTLLGKRIPKNIRVFLLTLAIIDDIGSIIVIGIFYNHPSNITALIIAIILSLSLLIVRKKKWWITGFMIMGFCVWYCLLLAGISGTMAGVIVAALAPLVKRPRKSMYLQSSEKIEDLLLPITAYIIVPLFVFCSAGLVFRDVSLTQGDSLSIFLGVVLGLLIGKPVGIITITWIATKLKLTHRPEGMSWVNILGVGFIAGIGFTISLLIANLSFNSYPSLLNTSIFAVFVGSIVSGAIGVLILGISTSSKRSRNA
jgi:NhaA family Na+:H+ antiporter